MTLMTSTAESPHFESEDLVKKAVLCQLLKQLKHFGRHSAESFSNNRGDGFHVIRVCHHHSLFQVALVYFTGIGATKIVETRGAITVGGAKHIVWHQDMKFMVHLF